MWPAHTVSVTAFPLCGFFLHGCATLASRDATTGSGPLIAILLIVSSADRFRCETQAPGERTDWLVENAKQIT